MKKINLILIVVALIVSLYMAITRGGNIVLFLKDISIIVTITLPYIFEKLFSKKITTEFKFIYVVFIFSAHFLGVILEFYNHVPYFDKFNHFMSGVVVGLFSLVILKAFKIYHEANKMVNIIMMISFSFSIAALWELFEYGASVFFGVDPQLVAATGIHDTMLDIIVAFLGTFVVGIWYYLTKKKELVYNLANGVK